MLIDFSVENFRSIRDKAELSLIPSSTKELDDNIIYTEIQKKKGKKENLKLLKHAAIFGANASGKSNILKVFKYVIYCIKTSQSFAPEQSFPQEQFKLDERYKNQPSCFEFRFIIDEIIYEYSIKLLKNKVIEEKLNYFPNGKETPIFVRKNGKIDLFPTKQMLSEEDKVRVKIYKEDISDNILILSLANKIKQIPELASVYKWFCGNIEYISNRPGIGQRTTELLNEKRIDKDFFVSLFKYADQTILDIELDQTDIDINDIPKSVFDGLMKEVIKINNINADINIKKIQAKKIDEYTSKKGKDIDGNTKKVKFAIS
ncbi:ATP-binding protein, partial [bacterium]|nr:ATP-binding protein [bacterium]